MSETARTKTRNILSIAIVFAMAFSGIPAMFAGATGDNGGTPAPRDITDDAHNLIIPEGETYEMSGSHSYTSSVQIMGTLTIKPYDGVDDTTGILSLTATTITVGPSGAILGAGRGFGGGGGGGEGYNQNGGYGGTAGNGGRAGDSTYYYGSGGGGGSNGGKGGSAGSSGTFTAGKDGTPQKGGDGGGAQSWNCPGGPGGSGFGGGGGGGGDEWAGGGGGGGGGSGGKDAPANPYWDGGDGAGPFFGKAGTGANNYGPAVDGTNGGYMAKASNGDTTTDLSVVRGSGGGGGSGANYETGGGGGGGAGGAAISLFATNLSISGSITATGAGGGTGGQYEGWQYGGKGGGGAGGGIAIAAVRISFSGVIDARGYEFNKLSTKNGGTVKMLYDDSLSNTGSIQAGRTFLNGRPKMKELVYPPNGQQTYRRPDFQWKAASDPDNDAITYDLQVYSQPSFNPTYRLIDKPGITETDYQSDKALSGTGYWRVRAADQIGPGGWSKVWSFKVDDIAPTSHIDAMPEFTTSQLFTVSWMGNDNVNGTGLAGYTIMVSDNGGPWYMWQNQTQNTSAMFVGIEGHSYSFYSIAMDIAQNSEGAKVGEAMTTIDSVAPTSSFDQLPPFEKTPSFKLSWRGNDATSGVSNYTIYLSTDGSDFAAWGDPLTVNEIDFMGSEGHMYTFYIVATDVAGNVQATPGADRFQTTRIDGTAPVTTFNTGAPHYGTSPVYVRPTTQIYLNGTDNYVGVNHTSYTIDTRPQQDYSKGLKETQPGSHNLTYWSTDEAGNEETHHTAWIYVDNEAPTTTIDFFGANYTTESRTYISGQTLIVINALDKGSGVNRTLYNIDGAGWQTYTGPFRLPKSGSHTLQFMSVDNLGQQDSAKNISLVMDTIGPDTQAAPSATISRNPITVEFHATDLVSGLANTFYRITRKGDPVMNFQNGSEATVPAADDHTKDGVYTIDYYSVDNVGNAEQTRSLQVTIDTTGALNLTVKGTPTVSDSVYHLKGSVKPGSTVTVNGQNIIVQFDGTFDYALDLKEGKNKIVVSSTDPAGNTAAQTKYVTYNKPAETGWLVPILVVVVIVIVVVMLLAVMMRKPGTRAPQSEPMMREAPPARPPDKEATP